MPVGCEKLLPSAFCCEKKTAPVEATFRGEEKSFLTKLMLSADAEETVGIFRCFGVSFWCILMRKKLHLRPSPSSQVVFKPISVRG